MKIYLASSWRNRDRVDEVDKALTEAGHNTFNFTRPGPHSPLPNGFSWAEIDPKWTDWTPLQYRDAFNHPVVQDGLHQDYFAMKWADVVIGIQPFGRSASLEIGWFIGAGKPAGVILSSGEPELMMGLAKLLLSVEEALTWLQWQKVGAPGVAPSARAGF
jgi:hypothetical protein